MDCPYKIEEYAGLFFINQLRPICADDFAPRVESNVLNYITEDTWAESNSTDTDLKNPQFRKVFSLEFIWVNNLKQQVEGKKYPDSIKEFLHKIKYPASTSLCHSFDWVGCRNEESKKRKIEKNRKIFEERFQNYREKEERSSYRTAMKTVIKMLEYVNEGVSRELKNRVSNNIVTYTEKEIEKEEEYTTTMKEIEEIQANLKPLREKLRALENKVFEKRYDLLINEINKDDLPYDIKKSLIEEFEDKKKKGVSRMPFF
jgi:hypothetical protein